MGKPVCRAEPGVAVGCRPWTGGKINVRPVAAGCKVKSFKKPNDEELAHDYLWRIHHYAPKRGYIGVFNRSHYEDAVTVAVKSLAPKKIWSKRVGHINDFEQMLTDEGTVIVKFFLHISKDYQKERLQRRLDRPDKHWKFNVADLEERARWDAYQDRYSEVMQQTSHDHAPWYVVPAERRWLRNLLVTKVLVDTLESWTRSLRSRFLIRQRL